jgi:hypothetical protein
MPNVAEELDQLIAEHGSDELKEAHLKQKASLKKKRGRPLVDDTKDLQVTAWLDAEAWARGYDIREGMSDNCAARIDASFEPEHKRNSATDRIRRKLAGTARLERMLRLMANLNSARRLVSRMLFVKDREALAVKLNERAKQELSDLKPVGQKSPN